MEIVLAFFLAWLIANWAFGGKKGGPPKPGGPPPAPGGPPKPPGPPPGGPPPGGPPK